MQNRLKKNISTKQRSRDCMHPCMGHLIFPACRRHIYYSISLMAHDEGKKLLLCGTRLLEEQQNTIVYLPHEQKNKCARSTTIAFSVYFNYFI
jgi:hypothetical protein